jgi:hypothetical protein
MKQEVIAAVGYLKNHIGTFSREVASLAMAVVVADMAALMEEEE